MAHFGGAICASTRRAPSISSPRSTCEVERDVPRADRASASPITSCSARSSRTAAIATRAPEYCWVFDPVDGTTNYAHGLPIFCSLAGARDRRRAGRRGDLRSQPARAVHGRARPGRVAQRRAAARVGSRDADRFAARAPGFPYNVQQDAGDARRAVRRVPRRARAVRRLGSAALDLCYVAAGRLDGFWEQSLQPWDIAAGALIVAGGGRPRDRLARRTLQLAPREHRGDQRRGTRPDGGHNRYVLQTS